MIGSVCTGYGGLDGAVHSVFGGEAAWFVEFADAPARLLAHHWPDVLNLHDVTAVNWASVTPVDVFCGGYPCQNWSLAGKRLGAEDERHVWPHLALGPTNPPDGVEGHRADLPVSAVLRPGALAVLRPRFAVFENVAGHLTLGFDQVLADLHELGYDAWWTLWNASDEGAPHRRRRLFVLAIRREQPVLRPLGASPVARHDPEVGWVGPDDGLFGAVPFADKLPPTGAQIGGDLHALPAPVAGTRVGLLPTPRTSDCHGAGVHGHGGMDLRTAVTLLPTPVTDPDTGNGHARNLGGEAVHALLPTHRVSATRTSRGAALRSDSMSSPSLDQAIELAAGVVPREFADADEMPGSWRRLLLPTPTATPYGNNQSDSPELLPGVGMTISERGEWGAYGPAIRRWEAVLGRPAPAPTMTGKRGGQQLSPVFVEWMMGLPKGHVTAVPGLSRSEQLKLLGNGVVAQQAVAALRWLAATAGVEVCRPIAA